MISKIKLTNFRSLKNFSLESNNKVVIITGPNAIGKTSILEAIYITSTSKSHRTNEMEKVISKSEDYSKIEIEEKKKFKVIISKEGKTNYIDDIIYPKISDFIGNLKVIMVSPLDIDLIKGTKAFRRRFLDLEISLLDKNYLRNISLYKKLLKERNEILKEYSPEKAILLKVITSQLCEVIRIVYNKRNEFIDNLNANLIKITADLHCEKIKLAYQINYDINNLDKSFSNKLNYDILTKTTNIGPHRDDFNIKISDVDASTYASEGQIRFIVLAIKLALKKIYQKRQEKVILLLDDIFASLDQKRINNVIEFIKNEHQTFITTTSLFNIPDELLKGARIIRLKGEE